MSQSRAPLLSWAEAALGFGRAGHRVRPGAAPEWGSGAGCARRHRGPCGLIPLPQSPHLWMFSMCKGGLSVATGFAARSLND